jgi:hypothetical protein
MRATGSFCELLETRQLFAAVDAQVCFADLNGDGKAEAIGSKLGNFAKGVAKVGLNVAGIIVANNEGGTAFAPGVEVDFKDDADTLAEWVAAGDVDGDGRADVAVQRWTVQPTPVVDTYVFTVRLHVLHGDGKGGFDRQQTIDLSQQTGRGGQIGAPKKSFASRGVAVGDLNGDGTGEILSWDDDAVILLDAEAGKTTKYEVMFNPREYSRIVGTGDLDGDGRDDLVAVVDGAIAYASFDFSSGGEPAAKVNKVDAFTIKQGVNVSVGDLDGDGFRDDAVLIDAGNTATIIKSVGGLKSETEIVEYPPGVIADDIFLGDVDGDGADDLFTVLKTKHDTVKNSINNIR